MQTSIVESKLSDGSLAYSVVFVVDGSHHAEIACISKRDAEYLKGAFEEHSSYAEIYCGARK